MTTNQNIQATSVSRFFSSALLKELALKGRSPMFARLLDESGILSHVGKTDTIDSVFDKAFGFLKQKAFRHEYAYKAAITHKVLLGTHSLSTASMINEFRVGNSKADVVILNGTGTVYEIKSERDSLSRLQKQIVSYREVFASVNVIVGENHLDEVLSSLPIDVGVMTLSGRYNISTIRVAIDDASRVKSSAIFDTITIKEAEMIMKEMGVDVPVVPNTLRYKTYSSSFETMDPEKTHRMMVKVLKKTRKLSHLEPLVSELPISLQSIALTTRLNKRDFSRLIDVMPITVEQAMKWKSA